MKRVIRSSIQSKTDINDFEKQYSDNEVINMLERIDEYSNFEVRKKRTETGKVVYIVSDTSEE